MLYFLYLSAISYTTQTSLLSFIYITKLRKGRARQHSWEHGAACGAREDESAIRSPILHAFHSKTTLNSHTFQIPVSGSANSTCREELARRTDWNCDIFFKYPTKATKSMANYFSKARDCETKVTRCLAPAQDNSFIHEANIFLTFKPSSIHFLRSWVSKPAPPMSTLKGRTAAAPALRRFSVFGAKAENKTCIQLRSEL